jgi:hypothetical protein
VNTFEAGVDPCREGGSRAISRPHRQRKLHRRIWVQASHAGPVRPRTALRLLSAISRLLSGGCRFRRESEADGEAALRAVRKERCRLQSKKLGRPSSIGGFDSRNRCIYTSLVSAYIPGDEKWERMGPLVPGKARRSRPARRQRPATFWRPFLGLRSPVPPGSQLQADFGDWIDFPAVSPLRIDCDFEMYKWRHLIERELR